MARTYSGIIAVSALAAALMAASTPASAQGLFDALFGRAAPRQAPPQALSYAPPSMEPRQAAPRESREGGSVNAGSGRATAFCVRTCDGRHFPMQRHRNATPAQLCSAMCPAAKTMVFSGSAIDHAVGPKGERYASLENAFVYRKQIVPDCTCNGKNAFGLAPVDIADDPTLHAGDIVATKTGLVAYTGSGRKNAEANFTPIQNYPALGNDLRNKLSKLDVAQ
jgi:hypothetical protein